MLIKWDIGAGSWIVGDCLEGIASLENESIDLVFTSPPYNLGEGMADKGGLRIGHVGSAWSGCTLGNGYSSHSDDMPYDEYKNWQSEVLHALWAKLSENGAIFYNHKPRVVKGICRLPFFVDLPIRQVIIWDRGSGFNHTASAFKPTCEWVVVYAKPNFRLKDKGAGSCGDVWRIPPERKNPHPAPFPVELVERAILATTARTILDPFGGSGTTALAAERHGRQWISIERDIEYSLDAIDRIYRHIDADRTE